MLKHPEFIIIENGELEPAYIPNEKVLDDCLRKESEKLSNAATLMNRLVYDSIDYSP
jgi:hypothetical protein